MYRTKTAERKKQRKNGIARLIAVGLAFLLEFGFILVIFWKLNQYAEWIAVLTRIAAFSLILGIYCGEKTAALKMPWILLIALAPIAGVFSYLLIGLNPSLIRSRIRYIEAHHEYFSRLIPDAKAPEELLELDPYSYNLSTYISRFGQYPLFRVDELDYFSSAEAGLEGQKEAMRNARKYIFMEYFAIENAEAWEGIQSILEEKAREGVEVRVIYDDMGSIGFVNTDFAQQLRNVGIHCHVFNVFIPGLNIFLNNRDHRKMTIIDGEIGFTGGYNLANEYFNITHPYGHWKDTGIRLTGNAVKSLTAMFLEMWSLTDKDSSPNVEKIYLENAPAESPRSRGEECCGEKAPIEAARNASDAECGEGVHAAPKDESCGESESVSVSESASPLDLVSSEEFRGFIQPYAESPLVKELLAENVYISMIEAAKDYIWFVTPYLILTDEMVHALSTAAKRGVDVRIVTPGIPDKKTIYGATRSFYNTLCKNGVRVFEYSPGFCHSKMCISDDVRAICGTINLDYRSLYHHFENGCIFFHADAVSAMKQDFCDMFEVSRDVTENYVAGRGARLMIWQQLMRFIAQFL